MRASAAGDVVGPAPSKSTAKEYVTGYPTKDLPERSGRDVQRKRQMKKGKSCK
jgi:hypothetical protein